MLDLNNTTTGIGIVDATSGTEPQCATALLSANHNRTAMAQLKRQLRHRTITLRQLLEQPPPEIHAQMTLDVLSWAPGVGRVRLQTLNFRGARTGEVNLARPLGDLTVRQRQWLIRQLADQR
jgi:hypothetical protein